MYGVIDCNNFYVSCERAFNPKLEGKPVVVLSNNDGCIISRSNEAKLFGLKVGESAYKVEKTLKENNIIVYSSNYALYGDMSRRVMNTIREFVQDIEIYSIDEAFVNLSGINNLSTFALQLRQTVKKWTGIPVSLGIAPTRTLSKIALKAISKKAGSNGVGIIKKDEDMQQMLSSFPVDDVWGIGRRYAKFLKLYNINTAWDFINRDEKWIKKYMGITGVRTVYELRGIPCISIHATTEAKKSICNARSFGKFTGDYTTIKEAVANFTAVVASKLRHQHSLASAINVFIHTNPHSTTDKQYYNSYIIELDEPTNFTNEMIKHSIDALNKIFKSGFIYKKVGVIALDIIPETHKQRNLFEENHDEKFKVMMNLLDNINSEWGNDTLRIATQGTARKWKLRQEKLSPRYTTRWSDLLTIDLNQKNFKK